MRAARAAMGVFPRLNRPVGEVSGVFAAPPCAVSGVQPPAVVTRAALDVDQVGISLQQVQAVFVRAVRAWATQVHDVENSSRHVRCLDRIHCASGIAGRSAGPPSLLNA